MLRLYIKLFYRFFYILLTSTNILIERNEMSAIFNFCRYACHVTTQHNRGHAIFLSIDNHYYTLSALRNIKITQNLSNIYQSIFGQQRILLYGQSLLWRHQNYRSWDQKCIQDGGHLVTSSENISRTKQDMKNR
jgi:hypothetical protein